MMFIYSHNEASEGAKGLSVALNARRIKHDNSNFKGDARKTVINWGSHSLTDEINKCRVLNTIDKVKIAANKLSFFSLIKNSPDGPRIPEFTTSEEVAKEWVNDHRLVVARTVLNGSSGHGIKFMCYEEPNSFVKAPLYVEYIKKKDEFRVHFVRNTIVDFQRKALRPDYAPVHTNWKIRNLANGFIFVRGGVELPADVKLQAEKTIACCGLDFGAIDLIYNEQSSKAYVLEVNTAPGLVGETIQSYANAFKTYE